MKKSMQLILIVISVLIVDFGQLLLKKGLLVVGDLNFTGNLFGSFVTVFTNWIVLLGLVLLVSSSLVWLVVLSKSQLSYAYPILSLGYVFVSVMSWWFFDESLSLMRMFGLGIIVLGVYLMSKT
jgi:multidrug transporter EmrE-like cation transporter